MSNVAVIGTGFVGTTTGAVLAHLGHNVVCADLIPEKVEMLNRGEVPILEAGLDELVRAGLDSGLLRFVVGEAAGVEEAEFVFLCVQTPQAADGSADLTYIVNAAQAMSPHLRSEAIVINKSTVPVGSTQVVEQALGRSDVFVVSNPEFLREGSAVHDTLNPDRIVIGSEDQAAAMRVAALFESLKAPLVITDPASAETIKYASNAFLATKVSFINAIANVCEAVGADVREVVLGMGYDKRIGFEFLKPGPGWGGSCFLGDESLLVRRLDEVRLVTFEQLASEVSASGLGGWDVLAWLPGEVAPVFLPLAAFTVRDYDGLCIDIRTKMGRRLRVTDDHPLVVCDGVDDGYLSVRRAGEIGTADWLPIAAREPWTATDAVKRGDLLASVDAGRFCDRDVIVRLGSIGRQYVDVLWTGPRPRLHDVRRTGALRLHEARLYGVPLTDATVSTVTNGTYIPAELELDEEFWYIVGLYLAEGHINTDGRRKRISWSFHHTNEEGLVRRVETFWRSRGVSKVDVRSMGTARQVTISSRLLADWFEHELRVGTNGYNHRIPDQVWSLPTACKRALLRGMWDGDGSWSFVNGGPSVVLEYGTVSRAMADGMVRLLGEVELVPRLKVGRTKKSTTDTYWIQVSGGEQVLRATWLLPLEEAAQVRDQVARQRRITRPTGHRALSEKAVEWARVTSASAFHYTGPVYSVEVPIAHTVVTSFGLVVHNCFPKDSRALVHIADEAGYEFDLLRGVIAVNDQQFERMVTKIEGAVDGSLEGKTVAAWGLTFKARTNDLRDSPAIEVIRRLQAAGAQVKAYDPSHPTGDEEALQGIDVVGDPYAACENADVLVVLTEWDDFRWLDFAKVAGLMRSRRIVDTRNLLEPAAIRRRGFEYGGVGRP